MIPDLKLSTPEEIQSVLDTLEYRYCKIDRNYYVNSVERTLKEGNALCVDGALVGAYFLSKLGYPPLLINLVLWGPGHVNAIFRTEEGWGSVGKSQYSDTGYTAPEYPTVFELARSIGERYRKHRSRPLLFSIVNMAKWPIEWVFGNENLEEFDINAFLSSTRHFDI